MADPKVFNGAGVRWLVDVENGEVLGVLRDDDTLQTFGAGGGGGGGAGGDSVTQAANVGGKLSTITVNGIQSTYTWLADAPVSRSLLGFLVDITESNGYYVEDPNDPVFVHGGAINLTWAQAVTLGDAIVAGTYVAGTHFKPGFRIFVNDIGGGITLEWSTLINWWRGVNGSDITIASLVAESSWFTGGTSESTARVTVAIPPKLVAANGGQVCAWASMEVDNGASAVSAGTLTPRWKLGTAAPTGTASSTGVRKVQASFLIANDGALNSQSGMLGSVPYNSAGSSAAGAYSIDMALPQDVTLTYQLSVGTDRARYRAARVWVKN